MFVTMAYLKYILFYKVADLHVALPDRTTEMLEAASHVRSPQDV